MVGIDLGRIYASLTEDELLGSDISSCTPRTYTDTSSSSSQNSSRHRNLDGEDHEIFKNVLKEMLEGSKESESVIPEFKKKVRG